MAEPIEVRETPYKDQFWSALRALLLTVTAYASGKGWIPGDIGLAAVPVIILLGQMAVRKRHGQLVVAAEAAPNDVAVVK